MDASSVVERRSPPALPSLASSPEETPSDSLMATPEEREFFEERTLAPPPTGPQICIVCGELTPHRDLLLDEEGGVCIDCHRENEVAHVDLSPWRHAVPVLVMVGGLVGVAVTLPQVGAHILGLGPTGAIGWALINMLPATLGVFLSVAALRLLRDAWFNPLDEDLPLLDWLLRMGSSGLATIASLACTMAFPAMALWPFL